MISGRYALVIASLLAGAGVLPAHARDCSALEGDWTTNLGATIRFTRIDRSTGQISGAYHPASAPERAFPLTGFYNPNGRLENDQHYAPALSIAVSFLEHGGITSWNGICMMKDGAPVIETEDLIIAPMADYDWSHVIDNHDTLKAR